MGGTAEVVSITYSNSNNLGVGYSPDLPPDEFPLLIVTLTTLSLGAFLCSKIAVSITYSNSNNITPPFLGFGFSSQFPLLIVTLTTGR